MKTSYISLFGLLLVFILGLFWLDNILYFLYGIPQKFIHLDVDMMNWDGCIAAQNKIRTGAIIYLVITSLLAVIFSIISLINMRNAQGTKKIMFAIVGGLGISFTIIFLFMVVGAFIVAEIGRGVVG